jgi:hypothetical protein
MQVFLKVKRSSEGVLIDLKSQRLRAIENEDN